MEYTVGPGTVEIDEDRITDWDTVKDRIEQYLSGEPASFTDVTVDLSDMTAFQQQVFSAVRDIPYGETRTYGEIAAAIDRPDATLAVGSTCGRNPVPIIIPCHRVVRSAEIGGYRHGTKVKQALLELEDADRR